MKKDITIKSLMPYYDIYNPPGGLLDRSMECHALFHYAVTATGAVNRMMHGFVLENDPDPKYNLFNLFKGIAKAYNVDPDAMERHWPNVAAQFLVNKWELPDAVRFPKRRELGYKGGVT